jgi:hypothetical protein
MEPLLARASHAPVRSSPEAKQMVSAGPEDNSGHGGEERVGLDLVEDCRSKFKNFDL